MLANNQRKKIISKIKDVWLTQALNTEVGEQKMQDK